MEQELERLIEKFLRMPVARRRSLLPGYWRESDSVRSHLRALQKDNPDVYREIAAQVRASSMRAWRTSRKFESEPPPLLAPSPTRAPVRPPARAPLPRPAPAPQPPPPPPAVVRTAGDHVDFREATFHDRVIGVQHNHYGPAPTSAEWRPVRHVDPLEFGVRPTRHAGGLPDVPPYVPRDCDDDLRSELARSGLVLVLGERYVGKSYTAWRGVRSLPGHRLYAPALREDLRPLLATLQGRPGDYVLWLDELTDHLGAGSGGLDPQLLGRLTALGVVVLGTMSPDEYYRRRAGTAPGDRVVAVARTVELAREWSEAELERLAGLDDPRAYSAYLWSGREGAASYFAIGHLLFDEWRRAGTRLEHPRGRLLVRAAVDLARCGVRGPVPAGLLRSVQEQYGAEDRESFEDALAWATTPLFGVSGLLVQGDEPDTWRAYGALVAEALRSGGDLEPVPDAVWWTLLDAAEGGAPLDRGAVLDAARVALQARLEADDADVLYAFADRVGGPERDELLRRAADAGHLRAAEEWAAHLLHHEGDEKGALRYLEAAAERGSADAAREAGRLHLGRAEKWLERARGAEAAHLLGDLLLLRGDYEAAHNAYLDAEKAGHAAVARSSAMYHLLMNAPGKARVWLTRAVTAGDESAGELLSGLESEVDDLADYFAPSPAFPLDYAHYGTLAEAQGRKDEARKLYEEGHAAKDPYAAYRLGALLDGQGRPAEARDWYRKAAELGHPAARKALGATPDPPATVEE
ncbi:hypothetical protein [Streptomyces sp. NPDC057238]|uniref:hypothetical protein n=1 Tax=Streptomyces sp. NPDC057238 TaxID=3346060 RepID=UPI003636D5CC